MQADFLDAHRRHLSDAERLFQVQRWANADHLYGIAAECGLKALMEKIKGGPLEVDDRLHIMEERKPSNAWLKYQSYLAGHLLATKLSLPQSNPFSDWLVSQRYAHQSNFDQARVQLHQVAAKKVGTLIRRASKEGLL
ncbi:MAG: SAM-dependent methyltransferase [Burkholderiaceae bacterium]|nr:MAG: SAM-dependent methyltransferase [Burkholderiaceae bacterium]